MLSKKGIWGMHFVNPNNKYEFSTIRTDPSNPQLGAGELCTYNFRPTQNQAFSSLKMQLYLL
jgi:hypothetical protein